MQLQLRKVARYQETTYIEGGRAAPQPVVLCASGGHFAQSLGWPRIRRRSAARDSRARLTPRTKTDPGILEMAGGGAAIEGYGKAAVVGASCEIEHGSALIHTLRFGNHYRRASGRKELPELYQHTRGPELSDRHSDDAQSGRGHEGRHYLTLQFSVLDAPTPTKSSWRSAPRWGGARTIASVIVTRISRILAGTDV